MLWSAVCLSISQSVDKHTLGPSSGEAEGAGLIHRVVQGDLGGCSRWLAGETGVGRVADLLGPC